MENWENAWKKKNRKLHQEKKKIQEFLFALVVDIAQNIISRIFASKKSGLSETPLKEYRVL